MSKRSDIINISSIANAKYGLVYSEILGWIDLGHAAGTDIINILKQFDTGENSPDPRYTITYSQSMSKYGRRFGVGAHARWSIKKGRSQESKYSIIIAIMMRTALRFENLQASFPFSWATDSGFSAEDLVSDLLGFYRVTRPMNYFSHLRIVSQQDALRRWDHYGAIGNYKNKLFRPLLFPDPSLHKNAKPFYGLLPSFMTSITPYNSFNNDIVSIITDSGIHLNLGVIPTKELS